MTLLRLLLLLQPLPATSPTSRSSCYSSCYSYYCHYYGDYLYLCKRPQLARQTPAAIGVTSMSEGCVCSIYQVLRSFPLLCVRGCCPCGPSSVCAAHLRASPQKKSKTANTSLLCTDLYVPRRTLRGLPGVCMCLVVLALRHVLVHVHGCTGGSRVHVCSCASVHLPVGVKNMPSAKVRLCLYIHPCT